MYLTLTGRFRSVVEATTSAIVSCLFKLLRTHADPKVLDPSMQIVRKAHAMQAGEIDIALYEGTKNFVLAWPKKKRGESIEEVEGYDKEKSSENPSATKNSAPASMKPKEGEFSEASVDHTANTGRVGPFEGFEPLALAVLEINPARQEQPERVRKSRAELAMALAEHGMKSSAALAAILDGWLQIERSRSLREVIERARLVNERPLKH
jgi:hypothetical protein